MVLQDENTGISLQRLSEQDKHNLALLANNKKIWDRLRDYFPHPYSLQDALDFIDFTTREDPPLTFGIFENGTFAGVTGLIRKADVYRKGAEIGYWLGEPFWHRGIAVSAVRLMVAYGFNSLQLERIDAGVFEHNKASQRVLEKCGFTLEGVFKNAVIKNGQLMDEIRYGIARA